MDSPKFSAFDIKEVIYNAQPINAYILTPKGLKVGKYPIIVEIHGGFFVTGDALYPPWFSTWLLDYAILKSAIIVSFNYRLLPESNGLDILSDIEDFWTWLPTNLHYHLPPSVLPDLNHLIVHGNSAGGTLAVLSAFSQSKGSIKAIIAAYPGMQLILKNPKAMLGSRLLPKEILDNHLKAMEPGKIVTSAFPPDRVLEKLEGAPYIFVFHGEQDSAVDVGSSVLFAEKMRGKFGEGSVDLVVRPGEEHGFDGDFKLDGEEWLRKSLEKVTESWLGGDEG